MTTPPIGKIYFAMVDPGTVYDSSIHSVENLKVFNLQLSQSEGQFAVADLEIQNPYVGLLNSTRKRRLFISYEQYSGGPKILLFSGTVTAYPSDIDSEIIKVQYTAQPEDWPTIQNAFVQTLKVAPYYNQLLIPAKSRDDAAEILSARSSLYHWNRSTNALTLSDLIQGATVLDIEDNFFFDSLSSQLSTPPTKEVDITIVASWTQIGVGLVDAGATIAQAFINTGGTPNHQINSLTPKAFEAAWAACRIPSGYTLESSSLIATANDFSLAQANLSSGAATVAGVTYPTAKGATPTFRAVTVPRVWYHGILTLIAEYNQKRTENLTMKVISDLQDYSLSGTVPDSLTLNLEDPVAGLNGAVLDPQLPSFFYDVNTNLITSFGNAVIEYAILRAKAILIKAARAVQTNVEILLQDGIGITCDHSLRIFDKRLPGGYVIGKVIGYTIGIVGDTGVQSVKVTIASTVGNGNNSVGTGSSTEIGFENKNYINKDGSSMLSELFFDYAHPSISVPIDVPTMSVSSSYLIDSTIVVNGGNDQNISFVASPRPDLYLKDHGTDITVNLKTMKPQADLIAAFPISLRPFTIPKQVDLAGSIESGQEFYYLLETGDIMLNEDGTFYRLD